MSRLVKVMVTLSACEAKGYYIPTTLRDRLYRVWLGDFLDEHALLIWSTVADQTIVPEVVKTLLTRSMR